MSEHGAELVNDSEDHGRAPEDEVAELLGRAHRAEVKANNAVGIAQATRSMLSSSYVPTRRYRDDREELHLLLEEAARSSRRGLLLVGVVAALAIGSFFGVAAYERDAQSRLAKSLAVIEEDLEYQCEQLSLTREASRTQAEIAITLVEGEQRAAFVEVLGDYPEPVDCSNIGDLEP